MWCTVGAMGNYVKVYLNDLRYRGLEEWQSRREGETGTKPALNALVNEALENEMFENGVLEEYESFGKTFTRVTEQ